MALEKALLKHPITGGTPGKDCYKVGMAVASKGIERAVMQGILLHINQLKNRSPNS